MKSHLKEVGGSGQALPLPNKNSLIPTFWSPVQVRTPEGSWRPKTSGEWLVTMGRQRV